MAVVVVGQFRLPPERMDEARGAMRKVMEATRAEDGCIEYNYAEDVLDPGLIRVSEVWQTRKQLGAPYASYLLHAHWPVDAHTLVLHYQNHLFYTLTVLAPAGLWRRAPRLCLRRVWRWRQDARMRASWESLQASLALVGAQGSASQR